ncbi:MAG: FAD-binding protein [Flavobacteriaceae bacterium]
MSELLPADEQELAGIVESHFASGTPLEIVGGGTKRCVGYPVQAAATLSLARLTGVTLYEPSELVIRARAGTPVAELEETLAKNRQRLTFDPVGISALTGLAGAPTAGGLAASNIAGPRRVMAGAVRDSLIGIRAVTGEGRAIKSGGRVMKDVTGLDLVKSVSGSWGTLAVMSEVTFKVLPVAETEATLAVAGLDDEMAIDCLSAGLGSPFEVTGAAHLPGEATLLRIEGFEKSVDYRARELARELARFGEADILKAAASTARWEKVRDCAALGVGDGEALWRVSTVPSHGPAVAAAARGAGDARLQYDWGGGLLWIAVPAEQAAAVGEALRAAIAGQGHATLIRAPEGALDAIAPFEPMPAPLARMAERLRRSFDPGRILNPGRMYRAS